eukprot:SAG11_NODE_1788_length_4257_cov_2.181097_2_plen_220_part_00
MNIYELEAHDGDEDEGDGLQFSLLADVSGVGIHALTGLTKGVTGIFTETYAGAKKGSVLSVGKGLAMGVKGAAGSVIVTAANAVNDVSGAAMNVAQNAASAAALGLQTAADGVGNVVEKVGKEEETEEPKALDVSVAFFTRLNNIQKASDDLEKLAQEPSIILGNELGDEENEEVEAQFYKGISMCRKKVDHVLHEIGIRSKGVMLHGDYYNRLWLSML